MKLVGLQIKLAELTGVKVAKDDRNIVSITSIPAFKGYSPQFGSRLPKVTYDTDMPTDWGL